MNKQVILKKKSTKLCFSLSWEGKNQSITPIFLKICCSPDPDLSHDTLTFKIRGHLEIWSKVDLWFQNAEHV